MTAPRLILAAVLVALGLALAPHVLGADARTATLPAGLSHVPTIRAIYPTIYRNEQARKDGVSWERLRRAARAEWMRSHPCATATLSRRYATGARSSWETMRAVWRCDGVDPVHIRFMECIPAHEGGYGAPDVIFGGKHATAIGIGALAARGNVVLGHLQLRPAWYRGAMNGRPGTYALPDRWDAALLAWAVSPVNQARATAPIGPDQYATKEKCP